MKLQVGVKLLIKRDDTYLFIRRAKAFKDGPQKWDIPGGRIEDGETLAEALRREVKEETSLAVVGTEQLLASQDIFAPEKDLHVVRLTYLGAAEGDITLSDEHDSSRWMTLSEVLDEEYIDSYLKQALKSLDEHN
jgi:8-oxo-dGTP diphosphatase